MSELIKQLKGFNIKEMQQRAEQGEQNQIYTMKLTEENNKMLRYLTKLSLEKDQVEAFEKLCKELQEK